MIEKLKEYSDFVFIIFIIQWFFSLIFLGIMSTIATAEITRFLILSIGVFNAILGLFVYHIIQQKEVDKKDGKR